MLGIESCRWICLVGRRGETAGQTSGFRFRVSPLRLSGYGGQAGVRSGVADLLVDSWWERLPAAIVQFHELIAAGSRSHNQLVY